MWSLSAGLLFVAAGASVALVFVVEPLAEGDDAPELAAPAAELVAAAEPADELPAAGMVRPVAEAAADDEPAGAAAELLVLFEAVEAKALAAAWKASKLLSAVGFTAKTMPA